MAKLALFIVDYRGWDDALKQKHWKLARAGHSLAALAKLSSPFCATQSHHAFFTRLKWAPPPRCMGWIARPQSMTWSLYSYLTNRTFRCNQLALGITFCRFGDVRSFCSFSLHFNKRNAHTNDSRRGSVREWTESRGVPIAGNTHRCAPKKGSTR